MKLLLDTHALLWWQDDVPQLGPRARSLITDGNNEVLVSVASLWEIAIKVQTGELSVDVRHVTDGTEQDGFTLLGVTVAHLTALTTLPRHHRDPFDHLLIAQAIAENATLMSEDRWAPGYPVPVALCSA